MKKNVVVTGGNGLIGSIILNELTKHFTVWLYGRALNSALPEDRQCIGDINEIEKLIAFTKGKNYILHLAAEGGNPLGDGSDAEWSLINSSNINGTYCVYEAARINKLKGVVFASSGITVSGYEKIERKKIDVFHRPRPGNLYGVSKVFGESLASCYYDNYGVSSVCLRIGVICLNDVPSTQREKQLICKYSDLKKCVIKSIKLLDNNLFEIVFVHSDNVENYRDLNYTKRHIR